MKTISLTFCFVFLAAIGFAQKLKNGTYTYTLAFEEWGRKSLNTTCTVIIKGDSIKILNNGSGHLTGAKGDVIDSGIIIKHKTGKYIIAENKKDKNAAEIGGCTGGPRVISFTRKTYYKC